MQPSFNEIEKQFEWATKITNLNNINKKRSNPVQIKKQKSINLFVCLRENKINIQTVFIPVK